MMKTCQTSIKQSNPKKKERERYKIEGPKCRPKERTTNKGRWQGGHEKIKSLNPGNISDEEREGTLERTLSLQEPPTTTAGEDTMFRTEFTSWPNPSLKSL
jgi:hypothetical protein